METLMSGVVAPPDTTRLRYRSSSGRGRVGGRSNGCVTAVWRYAALTPLFFAIALTDCATGTGPSVPAPGLTTNDATTTASAERAGEVRTQVLMPKKWQPIRMVSEPSVQVGDVSAVYVTVSASVPVSDAQPLHVRLPHAVTQSGDVVRPLDLDSAIERAGGASELASPLEHLPSVARKFTEDAVVGTVLGAGIPRSLHGSDCCRRGCDQVSSQSTK